MTLTAPPRLLLVHAHPDDEALWTGGTIARHAAHGVQVTVVTCTLGEEGEVIPEHLRGLASDRADQLGGYRLGELRSACSALGVAEHRFLGGLGRWRDSGMVWQEPGRAAGTVPDAHPRALVNGDFPEQCEALETVLREVKPQVVVTYAADGGYGHPDHIRAHDVTMAATAKVPDVQRVFHVVPSREAIRTGLERLSRAEGMPFRLPQLAELPHVDDASITTTVDIGEHLPAKIGGLRAHGTQVRVWLDQWDSGAGIAGYALSNDVAQPVVPTEHYVLARGEQQGASTGLFGGLGGDETGPADGR
ncbi:N-acetyl-1-D-myo-inositol-2-amino-2-deoxy-alpha-D-glucopyranoside deacetylase [Halopolyspora algeriensis]|uniref:1D-myo-inositol 2-acetamido-2-deoxy-alpha-D-glucopyranoside deacetylase n=1 Tax=Halopolyspora algeriensis TaxID=1500506 RepID=A0A368VMN5_9ACTN|nr:N-acetyl-1-D-myo-inositol-2-amino-2-deoxy-alpha-D-glucopyranoside deacetylase [Halopolyspora algeriensis]RCW42770.1 N-acetyl-1-D-myo-inositol-2-amino-2-deoxy-alpha-D-glucopyranoside deacetylase [Halopolyspora algeriensis]TQM56760.1 N-acetyl-1-D-myo-inositol-2-amino-2-deoxy-alpha-D-glucopyranoside deacetylase [Halopolyspora algeriensis]